MPSDKCGGVRQLWVDEEHLPVSHWWDIGVKEHHEQIGQAGISFPKYQFVVHVYTIILCL